MICDFYLTVTVDYFFLFIPTVKQFNLNVIWPIQYSYFLLNTVTFGNIIILIRLLLNHRLFIHIYIFSYIPTKICMCYWYTVCLKQDIDNNCLVLGKQNYSILLILQLLGWLSCIAQVNTTSKIRLWWSRILTQYQIIICRWSFGSYQPYFIFYMHGWTE